jgi:hypothetical protein
LAELKTVRPRAVVKVRTSMESYPIDLAPGQVVRWMLDEDRRHAFDVLVNATRVYRPGELRDGLSEQLDDAEREELSEISEVGHLEIRPRQKPHLWALRVRVEDDIGSRLPEDEPLPEGEEEIDLQAFYEEFVAVDRGVAEVSVEVENAAAKANLNKLLDAILTDRHDPGKGTPRPGKRPA